MFNEETYEPETPKKILKITDLTFALPDNFNGDLADAMTLLAGYLNKEFVSADYNRCDVPNIYDDQEDYKVTMKFGIFEKNDEGDYNLL